jgi:hypothetical protein
MLNRNCIAIFCVCFYLSAVGQPIESKDLQKYSSEINSLQLACYGKTFRDIKDNQVCTISIPKDNFKILYSSRLGYKATYQNISGNELLYVTEDIDFSKAINVTASNNIVKTGLQAVRVTFPDGSIHIKVIENGIVLKTVVENYLDFFYQTGNTVNKNKLITDLNALIKLVSKESASYNSTKRGNLTFDDGIYTGEYIRYRTRQGKGTFIIGRGIYKGDKIDGEWKDDQFEGVVVHKFANGDKYEGEFIFDGRVGKGKMKYFGTGGKEYDGNWLNGKWQGKGVLTFWDGERYDGEWQNGLKQGKGLLILADGHKYDGQWRNDKKDGRGIYTSSDGGHKYDGEWKNDQKNGKGIFHYPGGETYTGEWKDDHYNGRGMYTSSDGSNKYDGEWKDGKKDGRGVMLDKNNKIIKEGYWVAGVFKN